MNISTIDNINKKWINTILPVPEERQFLHYNAYWYGQSCIIEDIESRLVYENCHDKRPFAFITFGQCYADEYLQHPIPGIAEIYHLVVIPKMQGRGFGKHILSWVENEFALLTAFKAIRVAHAPQNTRAGAMYTKMGYKRIGKNYEGDPWLEKTIGS